jgi:ankyrin repeat protein
LVGLSSASDEFAEAVHVACTFANADVVRLFVNKAGKNGYAHEAATNMNEKVLQLLIDAGADVGTANGYDETPAHQAAANANEKVLQRRQRRREQGR